jgi:hypothetical protein
MERHYRNKINIIGFAWNFLSLHNIYFKTCSFQLGNVVFIFGFPRVSLCDLKLMFFSLLLPLWQTYQTDVVQTKYL